MSFQYNTIEEALADLKENGTVIKIYDDEGKLLTDTVLANKAQKDKSRLAYQNGSSKIYRVAPVKMFSGSTQAWVPMPLLAIAQKDIAGIEFGETFISGNVLAEAKMENSAVRKFLSMLGFVAYDGIVRRQDFIAAYSDITPLTSNIHLYSGLIYRLNLYAFKDAYWLGIALSAEKIARQDVPQLIAEKNPYYADWLFQLSNQDGEILYSILAE